MSEYQFYEFMTVDRRLSAQDMDYMHSLSSRAKVTPYSASYVYSWGDFRGDHEKILRERFDACLYVANWGTSQLMFRFPNGSIDFAVLEAYAIADFITMSETDTHVILNILDQPEDGFWDWVEEGDGKLSEMLPLREAIINGDYRALYLAWLAGVYSAFSDCIESSDKVPFQFTPTVGCWDAEEFPLTALEPPVPPNLAKTSLALDALIDFFGVPKELIEAGKLRSGGQHIHDYDDAWVDALTEAEAKGYLKTILKGDIQAVKQVGSQIRRRFGTVAPIAPDPTPRRTIAELLQEANRQGQRLAQAERERAEAERLQKINQTAQREAALWAELEPLRDTQKAKAYDQAIEYLLALRDLHTHRGTMPTFSAKLEQFRATLSPNSSLRRRMKAVGL